MMPRNVPYHSVVKRIIIAAPTDIVAVSPKNWSNPDNVASATPRPPGIKLSAPAREAKLKVKVETIIPI